ncbi:MAG: 30S ribosomal protein S8e [Thermoplasmatota archaeon]
MAIWQGGSRRKSSGGRLKRSHKKRRFEIGSEAILATIGTHKTKKVRVRAGHTRSRVIKAEIANVTNPKTGKTVQAEIKTVTANPANPHYIRRNVVTKGAEIDTSAGRARVTSRPGQDGIVNAVLVG